jgi:hypothetical protein
LRACDVVNTDDPKARRRCSKLDSAHAETFRSRRCIEAAPLDHLECRGVPVAGEFLLAFDMTELVVESRATGRVPVNKC